jgi:serralysin
VSRRFVRLALALVAASATVMLPVGTQADPIPLKNAAMISKTDGGYLYRAGQQDSHLVISRVDGGLRFADRGTAELRSIPGSCHRKKVRTGIAAVCSVPSRFGARNPMTLQIWPRLGDDYVDSRTLSRAFRLSVLADAGHDVVKLGAGNDFVNGAQDGDRIRGGAGRDWIRTGIGNDRIFGGAGRDKLVGTDGRDRIRGGDGNDRTYGGNGGDVIYGGAGRDLVSCGGGFDRAYVDRFDRRNACESIHH